MPDLLHTWKEKAEELEALTFTLYLAARHPRTPWYARAFAILTAAYAFSPIDLIPDFIPLLGYLDDLVIVPLGVWITIKLVPADVFAECRTRATEMQSNRPPGFRWMGVVVILIWAAGLIWLGLTLYRLWRLR